jgi:hypothetical protein
MTKHKRSTKRGRSTPTVRLPVLKADSHCQRLTVCGHLMARELPRELEAASRELESKYVIEECCNYILLVAGEGHLHIDLARCEYFQDSPPPAKDSIDSVHLALDAVIGQEVGTRIDGIYSLPVGDAPDFIQSALQVEATVGNVSLTTNGGRFRIGGARAVSMEWWLPSGSDQLCIIIHAQRKTTVLDSYLEDCFSDLESTFGALFLGQ